MRYAKFPCTINTTSGPAALPGDLSMLPSTSSILRNAGFAPVLATLLGLTLSACSDSSDPDQAVPLPPEPSPPVYSFSAVDDRFQRFLDENEVFDGISYTIVDR